MCDPVTAGLALGASASSAAAVGTMAYLGAGALGTQMYSANKASKAQKEANAISVAQAKTAADQADQATNRANAKSPDVAGLLSANTLSAKAGQSGTMLTGTQGVDPNTLMLGKKTLLGG